jgi:hypothetical protein
MILSVVLYEGRNLVADIRERRDIEGEWGQGAENILAEKGWNN